MLPLFLWRFDVMRASRSAGVAAVLTALACGVHPPPEPTPKKNPSLSLPHTGASTVDSTMKLYLAYDKEPKLISMPSPVYPKEALERRVEGTVLIRVLVGEDGRVKDWLVIWSIPLLDEAAVAAVRRAVFEPALQGETPVAVWMVVPVEFWLSK